MGGICEYCEPGGYWECGEGDRCLVPEPDQDNLLPKPTINEDRCHSIWVIGRQRFGCLEAKLWVPGLPKPKGWKKWDKVKIRVQTFWDADGNPQAKVYVPKCDVIKKKRCKGWQGEQKVTAVFGGEFKMTFSSEADDEDIQSELTYLDSSPAEATSEEE